MILFGSMARGSAGPGSDVDLLVVWRGRLNEGLSGLVEPATEVWLESGVDLSVHPVLEERFNEMVRIRTGFYENLDREGILVDG